MNQNRITRVTVKNYRSLADVTVDLGPLTVLVGLNGSGKSNFIDVLRFVSEALRDGLDIAIQRRGGIDRIRRWSADGELHDVTIYFEFQMHGVPSVYSFSLGSEQTGEYFVKHERYAEHDTVSWEIKDGEWSFNPHDDKLSEQDLVFRQIRNKMFSQEQRFMSGASFYQLFPEGLQKPQEATYPYPLYSDGQNFCSALRRFLSDNERVDELRSRLAQIVPGVSDVQVLQISSFLVVQLHYKHGAAFELDMESDGTVRMLGLLLALYQEPARALLTIEEPELMVHPGAAGVLCDVMVEASLRSQIILTTHSPDLIARFSADSLRVVERDEDGNTHIGPLDEIQIGVIEDQLFSTSDLLRIEGLRRAPVTS